MRMSLESEQAAQDASMFIGQYQHSFDNKGRIQIPKKFREQLSEGAVVTEGLDGCLFLHPKRRWEEFEQELITLPITRADARVFMRHMLANAVEVVVDKTGRVLVPEYLRQKANLTDEALVIGVGKRIEIWEPRGWEEYQQKIRPEEVGERLAQIGL